MPVTGFLRSADTLATMEAVRALGVTVDDTGADRLVVHGGGWEGLREPVDVIDVKNAGTLIRLLPGLVASLPSWSSSPATRASAAARWPVSRNRSP